MVWKRQRSLAPGLAWTCSLAVVAWLLAQAVPVVGAPVIAIVLGLLVSIAHRPPARAVAGVAFSSSVLLQVAIVLLGSGLSLGELLRLGGRSLPVMLGTFAAALAGAVVVGRLLAVSPRLRSLIGIGTGICGASAIVAVSGIVEATETEIAYAISTIFLFNIAAILLFPPLGRLFGLSQHGFALWAGTAVNDTSSVAATAYAFGHVAGSQAIAVKLTRTTLIVPTALALSVLRTNGAVRRARPSLPPFLIFFVLASALTTVGMIPPATQHLLADVALALITVALAGVGLGSHLGRMREFGMRPVVLGAILWLTVASVSLGLQTLTGQR